MAGISEMWSQSRDDRTQAYEIIPPYSAPTSCGRRILRYSVVAGVTLLLVSFAIDRVLDHLLQGTDAPQDSSMRGAVDLFHLAPHHTGYVQEKTCPDDGSICICTKNFAVKGKDSFGYNRIEEKHGESACQPWRFQVGDMIFMEKPAGDQPEYREANLVAGFTGTPVVHNAIVIEVPPEGEPQTGDNVIALEALKGQWKKVVQNNIRKLVERYPFGGVSVRRVDSHRYPDFFTDDTRSRISEWAKQVTEEPFDVDMVNPTRKQLFTKGRYIPVEPSCKERTRADKMYIAGGPHQWICTQLVAWTIAFPGKLNLNPANLDNCTDAADRKVRKDNCCDVPEWVVTNLQPGPGAFLTAPFVQKGNWRAPCQKAGCYIGVPDTARWAGGTMVTPDKAATASEGSPESKKAIEKEQKEEEREEEQMEDLKERYEEAEQAYKEAKEAVEKDTISGPV